MDERIWRFMVTLFSSFGLTAVILIKINYRGLQSMFHQRTFSSRAQILIVNADDYGIASSIDQGIRQLVINQKISSLSVLVNEERSQSAAVELLKLRDTHPQIFRNISIGLHLNFTRGHPESQAMRTSQWVHNAKLTKSLLTFVQKEEVSPEVVADEFRHQVRKFIRLYRRRPTHVDGHNHIHIYPSVAKVISSILPQFGIYKIRMPSEKNLVNFGEYLSSNISIVRQLYQGNSIIWPNIFEGSEDSGHLQAQKIKQIFANMDQRQAVELMCHPGYPTNSGFSWTSNIDRLNQKQSLQSKEFEQLVQSVGDLSSYFHLQAKRQIQNRPALLIYSKLQTGTGNYTTTQRLKSIFQKIGYKVYTWSVEPEIQPFIEAEDLQRFLISFGISLILGINVSRSAKIIYEATHSESTIRIQVPYILVIAGTDANYTFQAPQKYNELASCLSWSQCIISISKDMTAITQKVLKQLNIQKKIYTIVQSSNLGCELASSTIVNPSLQLKSEEEKRYVLFPTSFRRIKCVQHVFAELNQLILHRNMEVYLLGPIIEREYYQEIIGSLGKIKYLGTFTPPQYRKLLASAFVLINCSQTQGMSCSILEALEFGVPVLARNNSGNRQLITHNYNGLIYSNPDDFTQSMERLLDGFALRQFLVQNGRKIFSQNYSLDVETKLYQCMIQQQIKAKTFSLSLNDQFIRIFNEPFVHNTSEINNNLFLQIEPSIPKVAKILDFGCGTAVFSLLFMLKANFTKITLYLVDISDRIIGNAILNCRQSSFWNKLQIIGIRQTCIFKKVDKDIEFDAILFNPPQTPFQHAESRLDKNGGINGVKFYQCMLKYFSQSNNKKLYVLYSYLAWPAKLRQLQKVFKLKCSWRSEAGVHKITKKDYDSMQAGLSDYIINHWQSGKAEISLEGDQFSIPAEAQLITKE